jgi:hypothetical protein
MKKKSLAHRRAIAVQRRYLAKKHGSAYKGKPAGKRKVSAYTRFATKHMRSGKTMAQAAALWHRQGGGSRVAPERRERAMVLWEPTPLARRVPRKTIMLTRKQVAEIRAHVSKMVVEAKKVQRAKMAGNRAAEKEARARLKAAEKEIQAIRAKAVKDIRALTKAANLRGKHAPTAVKAAGYSASTSSKIGGPEHLAALRGRVRGSTVAFSDLPDLSDNSQRQPTEAQQRRRSSGGYDDYGPYDAGDDAGNRYDGDYSGDMNSGLKAFQKFLRAQKRAGKSHKTALAAWRKRGKKPAAKKRSAKKPSFKKTSFKKTSFKKTSGMTRAQKRKINKAKHRAKQAKLRSLRDF